MRIPGGHLLTRWSGTGNKQGGGADESMALADGRNRWATMLFGMP